MRPSVCTSNPANYLYIIASAIACLWQSAQQSHSPVFSIDPGAGGNEKRGAIALCLCALKGSPKLQGRRDFINGAGQCPKQTLDIATEAVVDANDT